MSSKDAVTSSTTSVTLTGRVKWFNNKAGYGFITSTTGANAGTDVFVHHSGINVESQQYKYLVQGEYVNFVLDKTESGNHEFQASNVNGVNGGKLMCETRREFKLARTVYKTAKPTDEVEPTTPRHPKPPRQSAPKSRGQGPRESESTEWTTVPEHKPVAKAPVKRGRPAAASKST